VWFLVPAALLLISLAGVVGILKSAPRPRSELAKQQILQGKIETKKYQSANIEEKTTISKEKKPRVKRSKKKLSKVSNYDSLYKLLWTFTPITIDESCKRLTGLQNKLLQEKKPNPCRIYPLWIAYLSLETTAMPACLLEPAFRNATEAIQKKTICSSGYAFLAAYYIHKRIMDRSESFLNEALHLSKNDPWVNIVEGIFYQRIYQDQERAATTFRTIIKQNPDFPLAWYLLGRLYIKSEEYEKANSMFLLLQKNFPQQGAFYQIQKALSSLHGVAYFSKEKAQGLLEISKAFTALKNYHIAEQLSQKVLTEMKNLLPGKTQTLAFYELGRIYELKQDKDRAYASYLNALQIDPRFKAARDRISHLMQKDAKSS